MELLPLLYGLLLSTGTALLCVGRVFSYRDSLKKQEALIAQRRIEDQKRLADARARYVVAKHELEIDSYALKLACMEMELVEDEDGHPLWGDDWRDIMENLHLMAGSFDRAMDDRKLEEKIRGAC